MVRPHVVIAAANLGGREQHYDWERGAVEQHGCAITARELAFGVGECEQRIFPPQNLQHPQHQYVLDPPEDLSDRSLCTFSEHQRSHDIAMIG
jgi:hypothetical protein